MIEHNWQIQLLINTTYWIVDHKFILKLMVVFGCTDLPSSTTSWLENRHDEKVTPEK